MRQTQQENSARMFMSNYDCELPPNLCRELLLRPKRARILTPPPPEASPPPPERSGWMRRHPRAAAALGLCALLLVAALAGLANRSAKTPPETSKEPAPAPTATLMPAPAASKKVPAPRAVLVQLPAPRAQLVKLPEWKIDQSRLLTMPYGQKVPGTLRGFLGSETQLPRIGHLGDTWLVGKTPWIWLTVPGTTRPTWVDP